MNCVANNTFSIMMNHLFGFMIVKGFFAVAYKYLGICQSFDVHKFKTDIWYTYVPRNDGHFLIIYVIGGIIFSLICAWCVNIIKKRVCKEYNNIKNKITMKRSSEV